ncbi:hypothetical protein EV213_10367 [Aureibacillus halotolerans]|uniref:Uncharacterized protein n=1 Tax=Aureibacillus halotolerans TaxID=1508390 RepID=A0A4R6U9I1_9BACI|nr:hypothetical protein EV213_10367 [Aureibacillus halotolerans]
MKRRAEHHQTGKWFFHFTRLGISVPQLQRAGASQEKCSAAASTARSWTTKSGGEHAMKRRNKSVTTKVRSLAC